MSRELGHGLTRTECDRRRAPLEDELAQSPQSPGRNIITICRLWQSFAHAV
jgi:hypothetical protein